MRKIVEDKGQKEGRIGRGWKALWRPSARWSLGILLISGFLFGIVIGAGLSPLMEYTNTLEFCISCHEMNTVYQEYKETVHYSNAAGVRATCADCHIPKDWGRKLIYKMAAVRELFHKIKGSINTKEKFEAKRLELAQHVWQSMQETDSLECRNCHSLDSMEMSKQARRARKRHEEGIANRETCIDCHKGIAHKPVHKQLEKHEQEAEGFSLEF